MTDFIYRDESKGVGRGCIQNKISLACIEIAQNRSVCRCRRNTPTGRLFMSAENEKECSILNPVIVAAIITGCCAILAAIVAGVMTIVNRKKNEVRKGVNISKNRRTEISGTDISGSVDIKANKHLKIEEGKIDGGS